MGSEDLTAVPRSEPLSTFELLAVISGPPWNIVDRDVALRMDRAWIFGVLMFPRDDDGKIVRKNRPLPGAITTPDQRERYCQQFRYQTGCERWQAERCYEEALAIMERS